MLASENCMLFLLCRRLQSAKEKLRRLQELVRMVQTNPESTDDVDGPSSQLLTLAQSLQQPAQRQQPPHVSV